MAEIADSPIRMEEDPERSRSRRLTLRKSSKLRHRSLVEGLFANGKGVYDFPLRIVWRALSEEELKTTFCNFPPDRIGKLQMLITVPKKKRRHAVDRVLVRRRIREAFRLNRHLLEEPAGERHEIRTLSMAIIYQSNENLPYRKIEKSMRHLLEKIRQRALYKKNENPEPTSNITD